MSLWLITEQTTINEKEQKKMFDTFLKKNNEWDQKSLDLFLETSMKKKYI